VVDGVVASQELGLICAGDDARMQACYLRDVWEWANLGAATTPHFGTLADDLPAPEGWASDVSPWTVRRWGFDKQKLGSSSKPFYLNGPFATAIKDGITDKTQTGAKWTEDEVMALYAGAWS
jgi:hypothetical protein